MGIDALDFQFRIEKSFKMKLAREAWDRLPRRSPPDVTVGELHDMVVRACIETGVRVPPSSWTRVKLELARVLRKSPRLIHPHTLLARDLGGFG